MILGNFSLTTFSNSILVLPLFWGLWSSGHDPKKPEISVLTPSFPKITAHDPISNKCHNSIEVLWPLKLSLTFRTDLSPPI